MPMHLLDLLAVRIPSRFVMARRFRRRPSRACVLWLVLFVAVAARCGHQCLLNHGRLPLAKALREGACDVVRVVDGDTLIVRQTFPDESGRRRATTIEARLRLLGVDCPETVRPNHPVEPWGPEASAYTRMFVASGSARLQFDKRRKDRYERFLAYVYVEERMLNLELVRAGLARVSTFPGDSPSVTRRLRQAEQDARRVGRGIWSASE